MMFLAIDIGNTNITAGVFHNSKITKVIRINTSDSAKKGLSYFNSLKINEIIISSVVPKKTEDYINLFKTQINIIPKIVDYNYLKFLKLSVDNPKSVGADRICNIISANKKYNGAKIIIDFGTATTFDVINENNTFIGGSIAPGIDISANYLYKKAALLRNTTFKFPEKVIGKNTKTNLQSGIMYGAVDSVEGMIKRIQNEVKFKISEVILTGGFSTIISPGLSIKHRIEKFLTLYGIYLISKIK